MKGKVLHGSMKWTAVVGLALATLAALTAPAEAERKKVKKNEFVSYYTGDPKFCAKVLHNLPKLTKIKPKLSPEGVIDAFSGGYDAVKFTNLYFKGKDLPPAISRWMARDHQFAGFQIRGLSISPHIRHAHDDEGDRLVQKYGAAYIIDDPRWRALDDKCPGFLTMTNGRKHDVVTDEFALYEVDLENDGKKETILFTGNWHPLRGALTFEIMNFKSCKKTEIFSGGYTFLFLAIFDGRPLAFLSDLSSDLVIAQLERKTLQPDTYPDPTCTYSHSLDDYLNSKARLVHTKKLPIIR